MKIAVITNSYNSPTELWLWRQIENMGEIVGYVGILDRIKEPVRGDFSVISLVTEGTFKTALHPFFLLRKLMELENQFRIDAYFIHYLTNAYILRQFIVLTNKKIFVHCHGFDLTFKMKQHHNPAINYHSKDYISFTSCLPKNITYITDSLHSKELLISNGVSASKIKVLYFGVPLEGMNSQKQYDSLKILFLGRFVDFKGPDLTIKAFDKACEKGLKADLIMVGDGPLMVTCQLLKSRSRFSDRIKFLGILPYESSRKVRSECHIFTAHNIKGSLSNQEEAYGVAIIEAMGAGLPIVTGLNGGIKETVIHNKTGLLFEPGNIDAHAQCLIMLAKDLERLKNMEQQALQHVENNFTLEKEKASLLKILEIKESGKKKNAVIIGPYRYHNFGDDLIGVVIAKYLQRKNFNVCIPLLLKENSTWIGTKFTTSYDTAMQWSHEVIIGGGGLLGDAGIIPDDFYRKLALKAAEEATDKGKKVTTTGIGAGPLALEESKTLSYKIASLSKKIGVRDKESKFFLEELGIDSQKIVEGADLALLSSNFLEINKLISNKIGLQFDIGNYKDIIKSNLRTAEIYNAACRFANEHSSNIILISNGNFQSQLYNELTCKCETLLYNDLEHFLPKLAGLKAIFTSHLHLAITAYSLRIPCFSMYVREKTKRFYNQIGHPERAIDLCEATVGDFFNIVEKIEKVQWTEKDEETLQLLKQKAFELLKIID